MITLTVTTREGETREVQVAEGLSLMESLRNAGFDEIEALCGGGCACATCHVYVEGEAASALEPLSPDEDDLLDAADARDQRSRLSCQIRCDPAINGLHVTIAPET